MKKRKDIPGLHVAILLTALASTIPVAKAQSLPTYTIVDLGRIRGNDINNDGTVIGDFTFGGSTLTGIYSNGQMTELPFRLNIGTTINDRGQVAGTASFGLQRRGFFYENGSLIDVGDLGGEWTKVNDMNNAGQIVGGSLNADSQIRAFVYQNGVMTAVEAPAGYVAREAVAINNLGQMAISVIAPATGSHLNLLYNATDITPLPILEGRHTQSVGGMNDLGQVVGFEQSGRLSPSGFGTITHHMFIYENGAIREIPGVNHPEEGREALDINNSGVVVGWDAGNSIIYHESFGTLNLDDLVIDRIEKGWLGLLRANAINDAGWITGEGLPAFDFQAHAFLLIPVELNNAPLAEADSASGEPGTTISLPEAKLLANDTDPEDDSLSVAAVDTVSSAGASIIREQGTISYQARQDFVGSDSFGYTISDGRGGTAQGVVQITISEPSGLLPVSTTLQANGTLLVRFIGVPRFSYLVQKNDGSGWFDAGTARAALNGSFSIIDPEGSSYPNRRYRAIGN